MDNLPYELVTKAFYQDIVYCQDHLTVWAPDTVYALNARQIIENLVPFAQEMAELFARNDPKFDQKKFLTDCGIYRIDETKWKKLK